MNTPRELGYRMPAEWHPHAATLMHWPSNRETWPGERLRRVEQVYGRILTALSRHEPVHLLASDGETEERGREVLARFPADHGRIHWHRRRVNDVWARDCGPIFVRRAPDESTGGEVAGRSAPPEYAVTDWEYNAWGGKYPPWGDDNELPRWFAGRFGLPRFEAGMVLEGGSIETDGEGTLITTESVLLNPNRNPGLDRSQIEAKLRDFLGVEKIIWLKEGLAGDDTDGHVDDLARFLGPGTLLTMTAEEGSPNHDALAENLEILRSSTDARGRPFRIETLPLPETRIAGTTVDGSAHVPASYANFYIANGVLLLPLHDARSDARAAELLARYFPGREIAGIPCGDLVWGQGSIHCVTQQLYGPAAGGG